MNRIFGTVLMLLVASACMMQPVTSENVMRFGGGVGPGSLCERIEAQRSVAKGHQEMDTLIGEFKRRNPGVQENWLRDLRKGLVTIGMPEDVARCTWTAYLVNESIGYGQHTKQYRGSNSYSYFFVDGRTGRVTYISA
ncbi:MAG TPA: hypothetical protein DD444_16955 [Citreicella sp.]|mgnify:CR=1 FL=1|jgi:hypothetical protein|nr:hypothetical protein [Citreicella sp.]